MKKQRKQYTPGVKVAILRRHLVEGVPISDLCNERGLQPTAFYRWQKEFFENGAALSGVRIRPQTPLSLEDARRLVEGHKGVNQDLAGLWRQSLFSTTILQTANGGVVG